MTEQAVEPAIKTAVRPQKRPGGLGAEPMTLADIEGEAHVRRQCGMDELDRVLGGGIVEGSVVLVGGDPGVGKSTLLLQVCGRLAGAGARVLYVTGEESARQIKLRANRPARAGGHALDTGGKRHGRHPGAL